MKIDTKFPYIFLDLDSVLTTPPNWRDFNPECVKNLKYIIKETNCKIVVHSTWRKFETDRNRFLYLWGKYGFALDDFRGWTPVESKEYRNKVIGELEKYTLNKKTSINNYIDKYKNIIDNYVIIDDEDYDFPPDKFVQPKNGLSFDDAKLAIEILNR